VELNSRVKNVENIFLVCLRYGSLANCYEKNNFSVSVFRKHEGISWPTASPEVSQEKICSVTLGGGMIYKIVD